MKRWFDYWTNEIAECKKKRDFECCSIVILTFVMVHALFIVAAFGFFIIWIKDPIFALIVTAIFGLPIIGAICIWRKANEDE